MQPLPAAPGAARASVLQCRCLSTSSGALYGGSGWDLNPVAVFQIAGCIANGCFLGGIRVDREWLI